MPGDMKRGSLDNHRKRARGRRAQWEGVRVQMEAQEEESPRFCLFVYLFETESHYVAQAGLELDCLLPPPSECWDYKHVPPYLA
jgi:hypothetical protein